MKSPEGCHSIDPIFIIIQFPTGESSDEDDLAIGLGGHLSESEDTWDYFSGEEQEPQDVEMINGSETLENMSDDEDVVML